MKLKHTSANAKRLTRHRRIRARISGTTERPRLNVFRSVKGMFAQLIDDTTGKTIASVSMKEISKGDAGERAGKVAQSYLLGKKLAEKAVAAKVSAIVFDRGGYAYHGRVRAFAEGARDGGLQF
jgi:large subunit ribosomal protein L18